MQIPVHGIYLRYWQFSSAVEVVSVIYVMFYVDNAQ